MDLNNHQQESHPQTQKDTQYQQADDSNQSEEDQITPQSNQALSRTPQQNSPSLQTQRNRNTLKKTKGSSVQHSESNEQPTAKKRQHPLDSDERDQIIEQGGFAQSERVFSQNLKTKKKVKPSQNDAPNGDQMKPTNCINLPLNQKANKFMKLEEDQSAKNHSESNPSNLQNNQQIDLQIKRQTAQLSLKCYKLISKQFSEEKLKEKSFHDHLIEMINETKFQYPQQNNGSNNIQPDSTENEQRSKLIEKYSQEIRKPFKDLFQNGIQINQKIFYQERIQEGSIKEGEKGFFTFHPTHFIAKQIFKVLNQLGNKKIMTGHYGISKTVSVCLFWHLVRIIDEYRFEKNAKVTQDMRKIPKMVYWSLKNNKEQRQLNKNQFIIDQFPQIKQEYKLSQNEKYEWIVALEKFYKKFPYGQRYSRTLIVLDQINQIASIGRQHKETIEEIRRSQYKVDEQRILSKCNQIKQNKILYFQEMKLQIQLLSNKSIGVLYLSSMNLQNLLKEQVDLVPSGSHKYVPTISLVYSQLITEPFLLTQLVDYFVFQVKMRIFPLIKYQNKDPQVHQKIRKKCLETILSQKNRENFFLIPLDIRENVKIYASQVAFCQQIKSQTQYIQKMDLIFKQIVQCSLDIFRDYLKQYFEKKETQSNKNDKKKRISLMMKIYNYLKAQKAKLQEEENKQENLNFIKTFNTKNQIIIMHSLAVSLQELHKFADKRLIDYQYDKKYGVNHIFLVLPAHLIIKLMEPFIWDYVDDYLNIVKEYLSQHKTGSYQGDLYENHFHFCVQQGNVTVQLQVKKQTQQILKLNFSLGDQAVFRFKPLSSSNLALLKIFQNTIKNIIDHKKDSCVVFPVKKSFFNYDNNKILQIDQINSVSKSIDIVFIENQLQRGYDKIRIWLFDLTVKPSQVYTKLKDFLDVFLKFSDRNIEKLYHKKEINVQVNYFVITPNCRNQSLEVEKNLNRDFVNKIIFKGFENSRYLKVQSLVGQGNCILKRIGWIDPQSQVKFKSNDDKVKEKIKAYEEISKQIFDSRRSI